jgi:hypothetical protein
MKKIASIIAVLMLSSVSGLSLGGSNEGVKIKFSGADAESGKKAQDQKAFVSKNKTEVKTLEQLGSGGGLSAVPTGNNH